MDKSIPLSLIINELALNTIKYAFPNNEKGSFNVILKEIEGVVNIQVFDDGVGVPVDFDFNTSNSLGMSIINNLILQLDADLYMLNDIKETDRTFLWLSIFLLMGVTLVPLFYSLVTDFGKSFPFFTYIFDINFLVIGIFWCLQFYYASKKGFFGEVKHLRAKLTNIAFFPLTAFIALILSFGFPVESNIVYMIIPLSKKIYLHVYDKFDSGDDLLN